MSLIEEVMRRSALERAATMPGGLSSTQTQRMPRPHIAIPPASIPDVVVPQFRPAPVDPDAMERNRVLLRVHDVAISRAYKILRTRVLRRLTENNWYTLGITGTMAGEGKSLTALNLALAMAQDETVNAEMMSKIREEGMNHSQVRFIAHNITDVAGSRLTP